MKTNYTFIANGMRYYTIYDCPMCKAEAGVADVLTFGDLYSDDNFISEVKHSSNVRDINSLPELKDVQVVFANPLAVAGTLTVDGVDYKVSMASDRNNITRRVNPTPVVMAPPVPEVKEETIPVVEEPMQEVEEPVTVPEEPTVVEIQEPVTIPKEEPEPQRLVKDVVPVTPVVKREPSLKTNIQTPAPAAKAADLDKSIVFGKAIHKGNVLNIDAPMKSEHVSSFTFGKRQVAVKEDNFVQPRFERPEPLVMPVMPAERTYERWVDETPVKEEVPAEVKPYVPVEGFPEPIWEFMTPAMCSSIRNYTTEAIADNLVIGAPEEYFTENNWALIDGWYVIDCSHDNKRHFYNSEHFHAAVPHLAMRKWRSL